MIHVDLLKHPPPENWLERAEEARRAVAAETDPEMRKALIKKKQKLWAELKPHLESIVGGKCWYSEIEDLGASRDVDHFRPKGRVSDHPPAPDGYWWLAFDWRNYRLSCIYSNRPGSPDPDAPDVRRGKGDRFPLRKGTSRCRGADDKTPEEPILLDPTDPADPPRLDWNETGRPLVRKGLDAWQTERVRQSIAILHLNGRGMNNRRKAVWQQCASDVDYIKLYHQLSLEREDEARMLYRGSLQRLIAVTDRRAELSAVANRCLQSKNVSRQWALQLLDEELGADERAA